MAGETVRRIPPVNGKKVDQYGKYPKTSSRLGFFTMEMSEPIRFADNAPHDDLTLSITPIDAATGATSTKLSKVDAKLTKLTGNRLIFLRQSV